MMGDGEGEGRVQVSEEEGHLSKSPMLAVFGKDNNNVVFLKKKKLTGVTVV